MTLHKTRGIKPLLLRAAFLALAGVAFAAALTLTAGASAAGNSLLGDADGDGEVTISDVTCIQRKLAEWPPDERFSESAADIDGNGEIEITDATLLQQWLAEMSVSYSIGAELTAPTEVSAASTQSPTDNEGWGREIYRP